jgi:hypothetical protein
VTPFKMSHLQQITNGYYMTCYIIDKGTQYY